MPKKPGKAALAIRSGWEILKSHSDFNEKRVKGKLLPYAKKNYRTVLGPAISAVRKIVRYSEIERYGESEAHINAVALGYVRTGLDLEPRRKHEIHVSRIRLDGGKKPVVKVTIRKTKNGDVRISSEVTKRGKELGPVETSKKPMPRSSIAAKAEREFLKHWRGLDTLRVEERFTHFLFKKKPKTVEDWAEYRAVVKLLQEKFNEKSSKPEKLLGHFGR